MFIAKPPSQADHFPYVVVGTGFGSLFFVHRLLQRDPEAQVLMLEWGDLRPWPQQLNQKRNASIPAAHTYSAEGVEKEWNFTIAYGGGTNCWYGTAPRLHPSDFRKTSLYGRGVDWPIDYGALDPYYAMAERIMDISGGNDIAQILPRGEPYPQPPHRLSSVDRIMKEAQPHQHFVQPTARARIANSQRNACCANSTCSLCPNDAKFTALNGMQHIAEAPNVKILTRAEVREIERGSPRSVTAVRFRHDGKEYRVKCDVCVLGANAIQSPAILARSGFSHPMQGRGLNEQLGFAMEVFLDGVDNFDGSSIATSLNYALYDGPFRADHGGALLVFTNWPNYGLRLEYGRWRETVTVVANIEDEPQPENHVMIDARGNPVVHYIGPSHYAVRGMSAAREKMADVLAPLPVERVVFKGIRKTESHLQGTLRMGRDARDSIVGDDLVHHRVRNLIVVGTPVFPSCPAAPPSLTAAALSLRAADQWFDQAGY